MAAVSTVLPIMLTSEGIRRLGASHASMWARWGPWRRSSWASHSSTRAITAVQLAGAALVLAGVLAISLRKK